MLRDLANRITIPGLQMTPHTRIVDRYRDHGVAVSSRQALARFQAMEIRGEAFPRETATQRNLIQRIRRLGRSPTEAVGSNVNTFIERAVKRDREQVRQLTSLLKQFHDQFPDHPEAIVMLSDRWEHLKAMKELQMAQNEAEDILSAISDQRAGPRQLDALYSALRFLSQNGEKADLARLRSGVEQFRRAAPRDERGGVLILELARQEVDPGAQQALYDEILRRYDGSEPAAHAMYDLGLQARERRRSAP